MVGVPMVTFGGIPIAIIDLVDTVAVEFGGRVMLIEYAWRFTGIPSNFSQKPLSLQV
jgi:hypothetical protein